MVLTFRPSDEFADEARAAVALHRRRILERLPQAEVEHRGGTSVPGVLTAGDVDLHVRVERPSFAEARDVLSDLYEPFHLDAWHEEGAFFETPGSQPPVEIALTVVGCLDDLHHGEAWRRIAADPELVDRYNAMKRASEGGSWDEYLAAKRAFFYDNFRLV